RHPVHLREEIESGELPEVVGELEDRQPVLIAAALDMQESSPTVQSLPSRCQPEPFVPRRMVGRAVLFLRQYSVAPIPARASQGLMWRLVVQLWVYGRLTRIILRRDGATVPWLGLLVIMSRVLDDWCRVLLAPGESDDRNQAANPQTRPKHTPADQQRYVRLLLPRRRPQCRRPAAGPRPVPPGSRPAVVLHQLANLELPLP